MALKRAIVFTICIVLAVSCAVEVFLASKNVSTNSPVRISRSRIPVSEHFDQWFGAGRARHKETVTITMLNNKPTVIIGMDEKEGWVFPSIHPDNYRTTIEGADSSTEVLIFSRFHPYFRLIVGGTVSLLLFAFCSLICINCVRRKQI